MIEFKNIYKEFQQNDTVFNAINDVNLHIETGEIFGIIGHSGAGKSTLIRMINHLEQPTSGHVIIDKVCLNDTTVATRNEIKKKIGMIFQNFNLLASKTVQENIAIPLLLNKISKKDRNKQVDKLLEYVGLSDKKYNYPEELSGGQKQRVAIARALANNPKILLCDEATSALDPSTTLSILDLLKQINEDHKLTIVLVTHEMKVVQYICNNVAVIEQGKIVEQGSTSELFKNPQQQITKNFINSVINENIPITILKHTDKNLITNLFKLEFLDNSAKEPVINDLILKTKIIINVLFANMIEIKGEVVGNMFISLIGDEKQVSEAVQYLKLRGVRVNKVDQKE